MNKQEFLSRLEEALAGLPREETAERLNFYAEMIDDQMEDGISEEEAVARIGPVEALAAQITAEIPFSRLVRERVRSRRKRPAWEVVLLVLGAPVWFPLLIAAFAILLSVYIVIWAVIVSLWAVEISLAAAALAGFGAGILLLFRGEGQPGLMMLGAGFFLAGLSILGFFACRAVTRGAVIATIKLALWIKSLFLRKEHKG